MACAVKPKKIDFFRWGHRGKLFNNKDNDNNNDNDNDDDDDDADNDNDIDNNKK